MPEKTVVEQETHSEETAETKTNGAEPSKPEPMETQKDGEDSKANEENIKAGPITRIVEKYEGTTITIRDPGNEMHPDEAVKIVAVTDK